MSRRAFLLLFPLLAACADKERPQPAVEPDPPVPTLVCRDDLRLETVAFGRATARLACTVAHSSDAYPLRYVAIETAPPFEARELEGHAFEVAYAPLGGPRHEGRLRIRWASALGSGVTDVVLYGAIDVGSTAWDPLPTAMPCAADGAAPLLDQALALTDLNRDTFTFNADLGGAELLSDPFRLSWFDAIRGAPHRAGCFTAEAAGALDQVLAARHPAATAIRHAAALLDRPIPEDAEAIRFPSFAEALASVCARTACDEPTGELPADLAFSLAPILDAIAEGLAARQAMDAELATRDADYWRTFGGGHNLGGASPDPLDEENRAYLLGEEGRRALYLAAARIAHAVEHVTWDWHRGALGIRFDLRTDAGWIRVRDAADDAHSDDGEPVLLFLDLGGDDRYEGPIASNVTGANAVSVAIDLDGADVYGYVRAGEDGADRYGRDFNGASRSQISRQGGARNGIAMLFDFGMEDDRYESLRASQGYAHQGVGVLFDFGGNDTYLGESLVQGSAQYGIGIAIDAGSGADERRAFSFAQGYGYVGGAGLLLDGGGDDVYHCDNGNPDYGGTPGVYPSPQLPDDGNSSFCQGAGFGMRNDARTLFLSGGIGILRDIDGDDTYEASVFAQGTGYWQGTGILSDGGGSDAYDAWWYVQGAAAHYALGILADGGSGNDVFGARLPTRNVSLGSGHDFSTGVFIDEGGDDVYHLGTLAAGSSNCSGIGLFVDNAGDDRYVARSDYSSGMGNVSTDCMDNRTEFNSIGVMIDAGGTDVYEYPASEFPLPANDAEWGHTRNGVPVEHGAGLDAEGETGVHAP